MIKNLKSIYNNATARLSWISISMLSFIFSLPNICKAEDNPYGGGKGIDPKQLLGNTDTTMSKQMKFLLAASGVVLIAAGIVFLLSALSQRDNEKTRELATTIMAVILCLGLIAIGFVLIGIGWSGANYVPQ